MLSQAATVALRILLFRAGPQDFPHAPQLVVALPALTVLAYLAFWSRLLPTGASLALSLAGVGALALVTYSLLSARGVVSRFQQTYHSLLAGTAVLSVLLVPPTIMLAPAMQEIIANPELLKNPENVRAPTTASWFVNAIELWAFALYTHVFRHATDTRLAAGVLIALFAIAGVTLVTFFAAVLIAPLVR